MKQDKLAQMRKQIDAVDKAILGALSKRTKLELAVGSFKRKNGMKLLDTKRRNQMLKTRTAQGKSKGVQPELARKLFALIHRYSLRAQRQKDT